MQCFFSYIWQITEITTSKLCTEILCMFYLPTETAKHCYSSHWAVFPHMRFSLFPCQMTALTYFPLVWCCLYIVEMVYITLLKWQLTQIDPYNGCKMADCTCWGSLKHPCNWPKRRSFENLLSINEKNLALQSVSFKIMFDATCYTGHFHSRKHKARSDVCLSICLSVGLVYLQH